VPVWISLIEPVDAETMTNTHGVTSVSKETFWSMAIPHLQAFGSSLRFPHVKAMTASDRNELRKAQRPKSIYEDTVRIAASPELSPGGSRGPGHESQLVDGGSVEQETRSE